MGKFSQAQRTGQKITAFFILPTFVFFLICSISVPVTPLAFLSYRLSGTKALTVGMWGSCTFDIAANGALTNRNCTRPTVPFLVDLRDLPGRKNDGNPFVVGKLSIPLVLYPISTALAFGGLATSRMGGSLSGLLCQGAAGLGAALLVISQILFQRTDRQFAEAIGNYTGGLSLCLWLGLAGSLSAVIAVLGTILASAQETRKNGSNINKEVYKMDDGSSY